MPPVVTKVLIAIVLVYVLAAVLAWRYQEKLAFPAPRQPVPVPATRGFSDGERVTVLTQDSVALYGWYLPPHPSPSKGKAPALIWFYGNMETVGSLTPVIGQLRPPSTGLLTLDYRGYGQSGGVPTEAGLYRDALAAWNFVLRRPEIDSARVGVYGRSLGSAVALYLATTRPIRAVVLDSPFSSAREMAAQHYRFLPQIAVRLSLDNLARAAVLHVPLLVFHGAEDRIAPVRMGRAVAEAGRATKIIVFDDVGHNELYDVYGPRYRRALLDFLATTL